MAKFKESERLDRLGAIVRQELALAEGGNSDALHANRQQASDYYYGRPMGTEVEGSSRLISMDVADMVNADLAILTPMLSTDAVVIFEPNGQEDEEQAQLESDALNALFIEDNQGYLQLHSSVKDALLLKNGVLKVTTEDGEKVETVSVAGAEPDQVKAFLSQLPDDIEWTREGDDISITRPTREFTVSYVATEKVCYQAGFKSGNLQKIRFFSEEVELTRSDLVELGIPKARVDELQEVAVSETNVARGNTDWGADWNGEAPTRDQQIIICQDAHVRCDLDGDGVAELHHVLVANDGIALWSELADFIPYAMGSPFIVPGRLTGESLFDHLKATQDAKTALIRQWMDNNRACINGRFAYDPGQVNEADVILPGGNIRARDPERSVMPVPLIDVGPSIERALAYQDKIRTERGGAALDMLSSDAQMVGETAHGIERQYASREAMVSMMARNLSETLIRGLYTILHESVRRYSLEPIKVQRSGEWIESDPRTWPERTRLNITTGMTPGQRGHMQNVLAQSLTMQMQLLQAGANGLLADAGTVYRTATAWQRMAGIDNPETLWIDPDSPKALQLQQQNQVQAQQAAQMQQQQQAKAEQFERDKLDLERRKVDLEAQAKRQELGWKYYDSDLDAKVSTAKATGEGIVSLEAERMRHNGKDREITGRGDPA